jgi:spermidine/putrescine transport system ATP-binding protein/putrescine transport system ATP-binding protein
MVDDAYIRIENITKRFGEVMAVDRADFAVRRGEFFSLLGPSGCGKTTLLRVIAGFEYPDEGEIHIDGAVVTDLPPNKRPSNMVFQSYAIFPHLNVADNIGYGLRRSGLSKTERNACIEEALAMIRLPGMGKRRAGELSGGQRQRVALARALVNRPKVLLLDEPLGALDKRLREAMQIELRQLQKNLGITFVFVTHDQEEALSMSDRIAVMSAGRVLQIADPRTLYERPNCREVADFIGTMNFLEGKVIGTGGDITEIDAGPAGRLSAKNVPVELTAPGNDVLVAVRPEKIVLKTAGAGGIVGKVSTAAYLGERSHLQIVVPGLKDPIAVAAQGSLEYTGADAALSWPMEAAIVLPRD